MNWKPIDSLPGHPGVKYRLQKLLAREAIPPTLLFTGPKGVGKSLFARTFAKTLLGGSDPIDIREYFPEGKAYLYSIRAIEECLGEAALFPFRGEHKLFLFHDAERMLPTSANALLKTLEEPLPHTMFILISSRADSLLPTLLSRSFPIAFSYLLESEIENYLVEYKGKSREEAGKLARLSSGTLAEADRLAEGGFSSDLEDLIVEIGFYAISGEYCALHEALTQLDNRHRGEEPSSQREQVDKILFYLFHWYRDLHLLRIDQGDQLFFSDRREALAKCSIHALPPLEEIHKKMVRAREALQLHIPFIRVIESLLY